MWLCYCLEPVVLFPFFNSLSGGVAAEVGLQPAELLDDPVPEAPEHQAADSAYAGAPGGSRRPPTDIMTRPVLVLTCALLAGGWRGE